MTRLRWLSIAVLLAGMQALSAQSSRALFPWWENRVSEGLNLSVAQRNQIRAVVKEYRNRLVDERAAVDKAEGDLEDAFNEESLDQRKAAEAVERLTSARGELTRSLAQMSLKLRAVLTAQQWQDLQDKMGPPGKMPNLRRRGPGGPPLPRPDGAPGDLPTKPTQFQKQSQ